MTKKVALVSGGTGDIGTAICQKFLEQGIDVAACSSLKSREIKEHDWCASFEGYQATIRHYTVDVTKVSECQKAFEKVLRDFEQVDILVNTVGIISDSQLYKMNPEQWERVLTVNLHSVFNITHSVLSHMMERKSGRIISISSVNGVKGQFGQTNYAASKAGIHGFTMSLAQEVARAGITVNTVSPGYVDSQMMRAIKPEILEKIIAQVPLGRLANPSEIADVVSFLAGEHASYITGENINVNGGLFMH